VKLARKRAIVIVTCLLGAVGMAAFVLLARAPGRSKVEMVLQTLSLTNTQSGPVPIATFRVSNTGSKSAHIMFDQVASSETPLSQEMPAAMAVYGECEVRPGTNCIVSIKGPLNSDYWRVHASVFEPASLGSKVRFAAGRLRLTLSGKPGFRPFWVPNFHERPYRLLSPEVPGASRLMLRPGGASGPAEHDVRTGTNSF
jgi:hypothetical protein